MFFSCDSATTSALAKTHTNQQIGNATRRAVLPRGDRKQRVCTIQTMQQHIQSRHASTSAVQGARETCAKISAAQAPEGPPPTTATRILRSLLNLVPICRLVARPERTAPALEKDTISTVGTACSGTSNGGGRHLSHVTFFTGHKDIRMPGRGGTSNHSQTCGWPGQEAGWRP